MLITERPTETSPPIRKFVALAGASCGRIGVGGALTIDEFAHWRGMNGCASLQHIVLDRRLWARMTNEEKVEKIRQWMDPEERVTVRFCDTQALTR